MPLFSEHISNMYYSGSPSYSSPYTSSVLPLGSSYSASYLNPGGAYSTHSSLGGYSRPPSLTSSRWVTSSGRNYSPKLTTITERGTSSPVRICSPRRTPFLGNRTYTAPSYTPRPININTADIDVSKDKYRHKHENNLPPPEPAPEIDNGPFMPRVDGKPETGIDSSPGLQRSTIRRGRTVVRLHTIKRKDRDSPRKPQSELEQQTQDNAGAPTPKDAPNDSNNEHLPWREKLSDDLTYKDKREKKTLGARLVEKFIVKDKDSDSDGSFKEKKPKQDNTETLSVSSKPSSSSVYSRSPDRRCSMELLAEQANLLDSLIKGENLSVANLDLSKVGLPDKPETNIRQLSIKRRKSSDPKNPLQTTKSDHSLNESLKSNKSFTKKRSLKKSSSGGSICRLDSIKEFIKEPISSQLPIIVENSSIANNEAYEIKTKPKLKAVITSSVEITEPLSPLKFKIDVTVEESQSPPKTPKTPKKEIIYSTIVEEVQPKLDDNLNKEKVSKTYTKRKSKPSALDNISPEPDEGNFWDKIGKRETVYLMKRKQIIDENKEKNRRALFWFPEEEEANEKPENDGNNTHDINLSFDNEVFSDACQMMQNDEIENTEFNEPRLLKPVDTEKEIIKTAGVPEITIKEKPDLVNKVQKIETNVKNKPELKVKSLKEQTEAASKLNESKKKSDKKVIPAKEPFIAEVEIDKQKEKIMDKLTENQINSQSELKNEMEKCIEQTKVEKPNISIDIPKTSNESLKKDEAGSKATANETKTTEEIITSRDSATNLENEPASILDGANVEKCLSCGGIKEASESSVNKESLSLPESSSITRKEESENQTMIVRLNSDIEGPVKKSSELKKNNSLKKATESKTDTKTSPNKSIVKTSPQKQVKRSNEMPNKSTEIVQLENKQNINSTGAIPKVTQAKVKVEEKNLPKRLSATKKETETQNRTEKKLSKVVDGDNKNKDLPTTINENTTRLEVDATIKTAQDNPMMDENVSKAKRNSPPNREISQKDLVCPKSTLQNCIENVMEVPQTSEIPIVIKTDNIPNKEVEELSKIEPVQEETKEKAKLECLPVKVEKVELKPPTPVEILKPPSPRRPVKEEPAARPLIATPRPLQKKVPQVIHSSSSSESSSEEESSDEDADESDTSEDTAEYYECENNPDGRTSTGSNDSGFDSSAPTSPAGFMHIKKGGECAGTSVAPAQADAADLVEQELEQSTAYGLFRKTGRFTPPARSIPRFRKYNIEDFHFIKVLGKGSFGKVLLAELRDTEYYYAVKCLKKDVVLEDDDVECTLIERKVLALGTNHPYLCHLFATFQTDSHLFFVMEYLNGGDLMFHIQQSGRFPEARARFYAAEIVSGLKFLHKRGIVYRDLKLDNILLDFDGHVRIADFGMCKLQIYLDKTADTFCGTPDYMAPEIIKGLKYNQTVDWWSFGVLLYEMLIGQSPFSGCDEDELFWSICNEMPSYPRFLSTEALTILTRLLDKDSRTRLGGTECMHGDVRDQEFFHQVHWDKLERRELEAPFRPRVRHPLDTQYFDRAFTGERPRLTAVEPHVLRTMDQEAFRGFSYTNPNATDR